MWISLSDIVVYFLIHAKDRTYMCELVCISLRHISKQGRRHVQTPDPSVTEVDFSRL